MSVVAAGLRRLWRQVGRRGLFLGFLALLDVLFGYFLLNPPPSSPPQPFPFLPATTWAIFWLITGTVCVVGMFLREQDRVAYGLAALLKAGWGLRYAWLWYLGVPYAWVSTLIWLVFAGVVLVVASWPEEVVVLAPEARRGR